MSREDIRIPGEIFIKSVSQMVGPKHLYFRNSLFIQQVITEHMDHAFSFPRLAFRVSLLACTQQTVCCSGSVPNLPFLSRAHLCLHDITQRSTLAPAPGVCECGSSFRRPLRFSALVWVFRVLPSTPGPLGWLLSRHAHAITLPASRQGVTNFSRTDQCFVLAIPGTWHGSMFVE